MGLLQRLRLAPDGVGVEAFAVEVELLVLGPCPLEEVEPFGRVFVAVIVRAHMRAEHVELVLEPAAHHVEREASVGHVIDGGRHLGHHQRMHQRHVAGGEHGDVVCHRAERRCPGEAFERAIVEVRRPAIAAPASDRQQRLHAGAVDRLRDLPGIGPVQLPGFRDGGDGRAMAAIERHDAELHPVAAEQPRAGGVITGGCSRSHVAQALSYPGRCRRTGRRSARSERRPVTISPFHRAFLVIGVLPVLDRGVPQLGFQGSLVVLDHLHDLQVLDRVVVVVELERTAHQFEIGLAQRRPHGILVLDPAVHLSDCGVDELDCVVAQARNVAGSRLSSP